MDFTGKALVTGASGFVGSGVARKLAERGLAVRALVRPGSPREHLAGLDIEFVAGDLRDPDSVRQAMRGVRWLFHVAADYRLWARDPSEIVENNMRSTRIAMEEAKRAGVERVVYTSSVATLKTGPTGETFDETISLDESHAIGAYKRSKLLAERLVSEMVAQGLPAIIVNPSTPVGPRDVKPTPTGRLIFEAATGRVPAFVDTGLNMVHVDDVAEGHLAALERGRIGERYILGGQNAALVRHPRHRRAADRPQSPARETSARRDLSGRLRRGSAGAAQRARAVRHGRWVTHVEEPHVLHQRQGRARTWATGRGLTPRASRTPSRGFGRPAVCKYQATPRRSRRKPKNSTASRMRRLSISGLSAISFTIEAILGARK